jgi:hypothetical protein
VCEAFNGLEPGTLQHFGEDSADIYHPFRDLYFVGLLGVLEYNQETGTVVQRFRRAHDPLATVTTVLPETMVYLIHPALDTYIRRQRTRGRFLQYQHITVGENLVWHAHYPVLMEVEKQLQKIEDYEFVELVHQVVKRIQSLMNAGTTSFARMEIENSEEWQVLASQATDDAKCGAMLWLEELLGKL